jgi:SAM-dependent methyltransferase
MKKKTIAYYDNNAQEFYQRTIEGDLGDAYQRFLKHVPKGSHILDVGCGVGRDSKYFLKHGYQVTAFDASEEMVAMAAIETGLPVMQLAFHDMAFEAQFDAVWAQASLLHVPYDETRAIYQHVHRALKPHGIFFASYKYGNQHMATPDRDFWLMDENIVPPYFEGLFEVLDLWTEKDTRSKVAPSVDQMWLNFVVRKSRST